MDLALFFFCLPLVPWNSPSGEKAIFPDASLHFVNIVRSFHPLFSVSLLFSLGLYVVYIVSSAYWINSSVTLKINLWEQWTWALKHVIILNRFYSIIFDLISCFLLKQRNSLLAYLSLWCFLSTVMYFNNCICRFRQPVIWRKNPGGSNCSKLHVIMTVDTHGTYKCFLDKERSQGTSASVRCIKLYKHHLCTWHLVLPIHL